MKLTHGWVGLSFHKVTRQLGFSSAGYREFPGGQEWGSHLGIPKEAEAGQGQPGLE